MNITEIEAKSILRKHKKIDSWFISHYGMNLYRGCSHNCVYCDGRAEGYYVEGEFGKDVAVKINGIEILARELDPARKRRPFKQSFIMVGGGVGDSYQPAEEKYQLSRKVLQLLYKYNFPVHVLTKSTLIIRDMDILKDINEQRKAVVSFSFSSVDNRISSIFEPGVPPPAERLKTLALFKEQGFACGMFLMPVIPFVTDTKGLIEQAVKRGAEIGVDFIIFSGMTLKQGRQLPLRLRGLLNIKIEGAIVGNKGKTAANKGSEQEYAGNYPGDIGYGKFSLLPETGWQGRAVAGCYGSGHELVAVMYKKRDFRFYIGNRR